MATRNVESFTRTTASRYAGWPLTVPLHRRFQTAFFEMGVPQLITLQLSTIFHSRNDPITLRQPLHPSQLPRTRSNPRPPFEQSLNISIIFLTTRQKPATIPHVSLAPQPAENQFSIAFRSQSLFSERLCTASTPIGSRYLCV